MLFQTICSEIDVVGKAYAGICEPSFKADKRTGLNEWWFYVTKNNPKLVEEFKGRHDAKKEQYGQIYVEKFTSASLICKAFYGKMKA